MLRLYAPLGEGRSTTQPAAAEVALRPGELPLVVGRWHNAPPDVEAYLAVPRSGEHADKHTSRAHCAFLVDRTGVVRFADLGSRHGSLLLPGRGAPRPAPSDRAVGLWPGDAVAIGGAAPKNATADYARRWMYVIEVRAAPQAAGSAPPSPGPVPAELAAVGCVVCHDPLLGSRVLPCGHTFCDDCISRWTRERDTCPTCRSACDPLAPGAPCLQLDEVVGALVEQWGDARLKETFRERAGVRRRLMERRSVLGKRARDI